MAYIWMLFMAWWMKKRNYYCECVHFAQLLTSFLQSNRLHVTNNKISFHFLLWKSFFSVFFFSSSRAWFRRVKPQQAKEHEYGPNMIRNNSWTSIHRQIEDAHNITDTRPHKLYQTNETENLYEIHFRSIWVNKSFEYPLRWVCGSVWHILNKMNSYTEIKMNERIKS